MQASRTPLPDRRKRQWRATPRACAVLLGFVLFGWAGAASAQQTILATGNAAVTGFSGAIPPAEIAPGVDPGDQTFIDGAGQSLRIIDLQSMGGPPEAQFIKAPKPHSWPANQIGQVFAVAIDDATAPNLYVAATSAYGLPIVAAGQDGKPRQLKKGAAGAAFMPSLWGGAVPDGGPGSIWKIDGVTGAVSLFANVALDGRANSGAALGGLAYDGQSKSLFVADRETGFIHRFGMNGVELGRYDHGVSGRQALGLPPVAFDPARHLDITSPQFDASNPATWNYAAPERRIFGLGLADRRLYYAVAAGLQIWSVGIAPDGSFAADARIEIIVPPAAGATEISKISFDEQNRMFLGERPAPTGAHDFEALTQAGIGRVLRYTSLGSAPDGGRIWQQQADDYAIGFPLARRNGNGGVAIGYRYDAQGHLAAGSCGGFLWATGEALRQTSQPKLAEWLSRTGPLDVDGLQGNDTWRIRRDDAPPLFAYFIDYDDKFDDSAARGHMGDIAIARLCALSPRTEQMIVPPPASRPPGGRPGTPPSGKCPPNAPPGTCPPPSACPPGEGRSRRDGQCQSCTRPNVLIGDNCCAPAALASGACPGTNPACPAGATAVGASGACCPDNQIYTDANGAPACCGGPVSNGQCPTPTPGPPPCTPNPSNPNCCPSGYSPAGNMCCLASQLTTTGVCCPFGQAPSGPGNSQCLPHLPIPTGGPSCCAQGTVPVGINGACCAPADVTTLGICCSGPVDPNDRTHCPAQIQSITKCAPGYTRMPNGSCCLDSLVSDDGKSCQASTRPLPPPSTGNCKARGRGFIRDPHHPGLCIACPRGRVANANRTSCIKLYRRPPEDYGAPPYGGYGGGQLPSPYLPRGGGRPFGGPGLRGFGR
jgi:hypothetical protein